MGPNGDTMPVGSFKMGGVGGGEVMVMVGEDIKCNDVTQTATNNWNGHTEGTVFVLN